MNKNYTRCIAQIEHGRGVEGLYSIIVPVLNNVHCLQRCIDSIVSQTLKAKELIIVDGGSVDGTLDVIDQNKDAIARSVSFQDNGVYSAFNRGVRLSQGEWILFLGSDDMFLEPDILEKVEHRIRTALSGQKIVYGKVAVLDTHQKVVDVRGQPWAAYGRMPVGKWTFEHQGIFHHRSLFEEHGLFDESFRLCGDHELLIRELKTGEALFLDEIVVAGFSLGGASSSPENLKDMIREKEKALFFNNIFNERVATRRLMCKIAVYESIRSFFGLECANRISRILNKLRGR